MYELQRMGLLVPRTVNKYLVNKIDIKFDAGASFTNKEKMHPYFTSDIN